jgi:hypothetical protein
LTNTVVYHNIGGAGNIVLWTNGWWIATDGATFTQGNDFYRSPRLYYPSAWTNDYFGVLPNPWSSYIYTTTTNNISYVGVMDASGVSFTEPETLFTNWLSVTFTNSVKAMTNGLATTNYVNVATNGFVTASITNGLAVGTNIADYINTFPSVSNVLVLNNGCWLLQAAGNGAITNVTGMVSGQKRKAWLTVSNSSGSPITFGWTAAGSPTVTSTNVLVIPSGKMGWFWVWSDGGAASYFNDVSR